MIINARSHLILKSLLFFSLSLPLRGQVLPSDGQYFEQEFDQTKIIYSKEYTPLIPSIKNKIINLKAIYKKEYNWDLDEKMSLVLSSPENFIGNGYATIFPYIKTTFYPGGSLYLDSFAIKSWLDTLIIHELAHLYQLSSKKGLSKLNKLIFNNNPFPGLPFFGWTFPNTLLPSWIIEGNAVLNESRFLNGGRLYSGESLALFNALLFENKFNPNWLINNHLDFPFGREKYIIGGHFSYFLSQKYGIKKTNSFFMEQANHYWNPLIINQTFKKHFGKYYYELIDLFIKYSKKKYQSYKKSDEPSLYKSVTLSPMNKNKNKIHFLISKDGKSPLSLVTYNIKTKRFSSKKTLLKKGKVFFKNNIPFSAHPELYQNKAYIFALWDEEKKMWPGTKNKIIMDTKNNKWLSFDSKKAFETPHLYIDDKEVGRCHSQAIFDRKENAFCFFQKGEERILLKNNKPIFKYKGYYGKISDIHDQAIYFIAKVRNGSSLFKYNFKGLPKRISSSDAIVEAKVLSEKEFLVAETFSKGHYYKVIKKDMDLEQLPYFKSLFEGKKIVIEKGKEKIKPGKIYSPLKSLRYSYFQLKSTSHNFGLSAYWEDPLKYNALSLLYDISDDKTNNSYSHYFKGLLSSQKSLLSWKLGIDLKKTDYKEDIYKDINEVNILLSTYYPLKEINQFKLLSGAFISKDLLSSKASTGLKLNLVKDEKYFLSYNSYKKIKGSLGLSKNLSTKKSLVKIEGLYSKDLGGENYASIDTDFSWTDATTLELNGLTEDIPYPSYTLSQNENISSFRLGLKSTTVFNKSLYFKVFPFSLRRSALSLFFNNFTNNLIDKSHWSTGGLTLSTEILISHISPVKINFSLLRDFHTKKTFFALTLN